MTQSYLSVVIFWACLGGVFYHYVGYPIAIWLFSRTFGRNRQCPPFDPAQAPTVSIVVAALNEEEVIADRIANALASTYRPELLEIVIASDGSTDRTSEIARSCGDPRVKVLDFPDRRGKAIVLNEVIPRLTSEVVILSDANTFFEPGVASRIVRWLSDEAVGVVVGRLALTDPATGNNVDSVYWRYETFIKSCEASLGALLGANGAIYGFRRELFVRLPADTLVDDLVLPLLIKMRSNCSVVFDTDSVAHETSPDRLASEMGRRSRIGMGGMTSLGVLWPLLSPRHGWTAFAFASHKLLRWIGPFLLIGALVSNATLLAPGFFTFTFLMQLVFYGLAAVGAVLPGSSMLVRSVRLATLFAGMNLALLVGFWRHWRGSRGATWQRTARSGSPQSPDQTTELPPTRKGAGAQV